MISLNIGREAPTTNNLFSMPRRRHGSREVCCDEKHARTCFNVDMNPDVILSADEITFDKITLTFSNSIPPCARVYNTESGDEAIISFNNRTGSIIGTLKTRDGRSFALEKCNKGHIFQEFNVTSFPTDEVIEESEFIEADVIPDRLRSRSTKNSYSYSMMFYYTEKFANVTPNIAEFIDHIIAETNQGYAHSEVNITVTKLCQEQATVPDQADTTALIGEFRLELATNLREDFTITEKAPSP